MAAAEDLEVQRTPMRPIWGVQPGSAAPGQSRVSTLAANTPTSIFRGLVELGGGRVLGHHMLKCWAPEFEREQIQQLLEPQAGPGSASFARLEQRFRHW